MDDLQARLAAALAGRYTIERELGRGGMSTVYLARDRRNERRVALKVLRPDLAQALGPDRFLREIKVAATLTHPHILPLFDSDIADGLLFYTMPYVEGESLRHRLQREGRLPVADAVQIARDVADALAYAHTQNIVHRDIKPENILIEAGHPVVSDFGIARAISAANEARMTGTGIVVGTVEYMSPEQAAGDELDGRSDIYSLGCVLYEMLTGRTPFAGHTPTGHAPALSEERRGIPLDVEYAIEVALAHLPSERFATAADFAAALGPPQTGSSPRWVRRMQRRWRAAAVVTAVVLGAGAVVLPKLRASPLDASLYVVVPFGHRGGAAPALVNGDQCELLLSQAFGRWTDVRLADPLRVHDARTRRGDQPMTLDQAKDLARDVGAGMLVWGDVSAVGDSIQVTAALYDLRRGGKTVRDYTVRIHKDGQTLEAKFRELADSILLGGVNSKQVRPDVLGTEVLAAFYEYAEGREALASWDLPGAQRLFRAALERDPDYAQSNLWLAYAEVLADAPAADWGLNAARALSSAQKLGAPDLALARALRHLANGEMQQACAGYRAIVARDSTDFIAWFGLGECQRRDHVVVQDPRSPSGWRFRSSYGAAAAAYRRALELVPSVHRAFTGIGTQRLMDLFYVETNMVRSGFVAATPAAPLVQFGAFPSLDHDTLAFVPYPIAMVFGGRPEANPPSRSLAVDRNRQVLREIIQRWIDVFPTSADAFEAFSVVLETSGELTLDGGPGSSALAAARRGRALSQDAQQTSRLALAEIRLLAKLEQFARARALADSVLAAAPAVPDPMEAHRLAGLAALTGRVYRTAELLALSAPVDTPVTWDGEAVPDSPVPVREAALALLGYAALGGPVDSLRVLKARVDRRVASWTGPTARERVRLAVLHVPVGLAFPQLGLTDAHRAEAGGDYVLEWQWAVAHGDTARVRTERARLAELRSHTRPGDVAVDGTYQEAVLLLQIGDSGAATQLLDLSLTALPTLGTYLLDQVPQAAALVRAMALRADLAGRAGDRTTAEHWARGVLDMWASADAPLAPTLASMRALAGRER